MIDVYLDLETIPCQDQAYRDEVRKGIKAPAQYKKAESIAEWIKENGDAAADEIVAKTSFDPAHGHICCIGFAIGDNAVASHTAASVDEEAEIISKFFDALPKLGMARIIGHNVIDFDLRFLLCRAVILGVKIPPAIPRNPKPWEGMVVDTMKAWAGLRGTIGQDRLAKALGLKGKGDFDGSMVAEAWANGEHAKIADYCRDDVETVRAIHKRFQEVNF